MEQFTHIRQACQERREGRVVHRAANSHSHRFDKRIIRLCLRSFGQGQNFLLGEVLHTVPLIERVRFQSDHRELVIAAERSLDAYRRGKVAIDRHQRAFRSFRQVEGHGQFFIFQKRDPFSHVAFIVDQRHFHRDQHRLLGWLAGCCWRLLFQRDSNLARFRIPAFFHRDFWRSSLRIPESELSEVLLADFFETGIKILDGDSLSIMTVEIEVHAFAIGFLTEHPAQHANYLRALFIDRGRVEIIDGPIGGRAHRVRQWAGILGKLACAQADDVLYPLHWARAHVGRKILITENRQAFLEAQLEPVSTRDPVASPVVEIFMGDDAFDGLEICVGRGVFVSQHIGRVEDVQTFVLHGAEIEVAHSHDIEHAEIILPAIGLLIPFH